MSITLADLNKKLAGAPQVADRELAMALHLMEICGARFCWKAKRALANEGFETFLLELRSDFKVSIPEHGTIKASSSHGPGLARNR